MVTLSSKKVLEKLNEQKGKVLGAKMDEIDVLLKPYTRYTKKGEIVWLPEDENIRTKYEKLDKEFKEIVNEINLMDKN